MANNKDSEPRMWEYWRDDKGYECAADDYYPKLFSSDPVLRVARAQLEAAKAMIDARMEQLAGEFA